LPVAVRGLPTFVRAKLLVGPLRFERFAATAAFQGSEPPICYEQSPVVIEFISRNVSSPVGGGGLAFYVALRLAIAVTLSALRRAENLAGISRVERVTALSTWARLVCRNPPAGRMSPTSPPDRSRSRSRTAFDQVDQLDHVAKLGFLAELLYQDRPRLRRGDERAEGRQPVICYEQSPAVAGFARRNLSSP
jgi:hypothetical protein